MIKSTLMLNSHRRRIFVIKAVETRVTRSPYSPFHPFMFVDMLVGSFQMDTEEKIVPKVFQCSLCPFYAAYDRYDSKYIDETAQPTAPIIHHSRNKNGPSLTIDLLETAYLLRDPFVAVKETNKEDRSKLASVLLGGTCSVCSAPVCVHINCSVFYTRRFCLRCVAQYRDEFPREILDEIGDKRLDKFANEFYDQADER